MITTAIRRKGKNKKKVSKGHNKKSKLKPRKLYKNTKSQLRKQKRKPVSNNALTKKLRKKPLQGKGKMKTTYKFSRSHKPLLFHNFFMQIVTSDF